jgi:glycosyltransferase involved in cell wall biosynthesis
LILAVGRLVEKKGFDQLVEACARLRDTGVEFECLIVGESGSASASIRRLIDERGLGHRVRVQGPVTQVELRELYARAHVFALPCQVMEDGDRDGFPNVLAEAMAMGVPVVSTAISGIPEMIEDGTHGLLVRPRDPLGLAVALRRLLTDAGLHDALAAAARARICDRFDSRRTTIALHELFVEQLRRAQRAAAPVRVAAEEAAS